MIFLMYIQNLTTIGPIVSEIICLIKIRTDGRPSSAYSRVMKAGENIKVGSLPIDLITILPQEAQEGI